MSNKAGNNSNNQKNVESIQKPIPLAKQEFLEGLVKLVNSSQLPMFVMEYIIKDVYLEVKDAAQKEYEKSKEYYENAVSNNGIENNETK